MEPILSWRAAASPRDGDAAQAMASTATGGTRGRSATRARSFFADKSVTTVKAGSCARTMGRRDPLAHLRNQGRTAGVVHPRSATTSASGPAGGGRSVQLDKPPDQGASRRTSSATANGWPGSPSVVVEPPWDRWIPFRVPLLCERAAALSERLRERGGARSWFCPLHQQPCFADLVRRQVGGASRAGLPERGACV
jgi:hypothetical protein